MRQIREIFGYTPHSEDQKYWIPDAIVKDLTSRAGAVVFHEAWPSRWPQLFVDVAAVHHPDYYQADETAVPPPGDWEDPKPNTFLAVNSGTEFEFAVAPRRPEYAKLAGTAREWLACALADWGVGAKTAAGYGRVIAEVEPKPIVSPQRARFECILELLTRAFLAGALQTQEDCDLRGPTLRGNFAGGGERCMQAISNLDCCAGSKPPFGALRAKAARCSWQSLANAIENQNRSGRAQRLRWDTWLTACKPSAIATLGVQNPPAAHGA